VGKPPTLDRELVRNESGRLRIGRCLDLLDDFCAVTQSVRVGLEVDVAVGTAPPPSRGPEAARLEIRILDALSCALGALEGEPVS
jgi:hypothetical protein